MIAAKAYRPPLASTTSDQEQSRNSHPSREKSDRAFSQKNQPPTALTRFHRLAAPPRHATVKSKACTGPNMAHQMLNTPNPKRRHATICNTNKCHGPFGTIRSSQERRPTAPRPTRLRPKNPTYPAQTKSLPRDWLSLARGLSPPADTQFATIQRRTATPRSRYPGRMQPIEIDPELSRQALAEAVQQLPEFAGKAPRVIARPLELTRSKRWR